MRSENFGIIVCALVFALSILIECYGMLALSILPYQQIFTNDINYFNDIENDHLRFKII